MQTVTKLLNGSQIIIQILKTLGIDTVFGYPGGVVLNLYDELSKQNDIKHYLTRHEQAACHAAEGYARTSGKCGIVFVTSGPGATNIITGLANAYQDGYPIIAVTGQVSAELLNKDAFQEVDIISMTKSCTKKNFQVTSVNELQETLIEAYKIAMSGRKGPVLIDITKNVFSQTASINPFDIKFEKENMCSQENIKAAAYLLNNSKKPVIIAGGGSSKNEVREIARKLNIPVVTTMLGNYFYDDENYIGKIGIFGRNSANRVIRESDLVFAVGTRLNDRIRCCFKNNELQNIIHLDINEKEFSKTNPAVSLLGDSKDILKELKNHLNVNNSRTWLEFAKSFKEFDDSPIKRSNHLHSFEIMAEIQDYFGQNLPQVTTEVGQHQVWASRYLHTQLITSGGLGTMGFGFPAAIGASIAQNGKPVLADKAHGYNKANLLYVSQATVLFR